MESVVGSLGYQAVGRKGDLAFFPVLLEKMDVLGRSQRNLKS